MIRNVLNSTTVPYQLSVITIIIIIIIIVMNL